jgi:uncharacterized membrane protein
MNMTTFISAYQSILHHTAEIVAYTLELVGILIIVAGSVKAVIHLIRHLRAPRSFNIFINLGRSLALALEFKMGAEIINTVIVHEWKELITLALVILVRALLSVIIHWEIKMERESERVEALREAEDSDEKKK